MLKLGNGWVDFSIWYIFGKGIYSACKQKRNQKLEIILIYKNSSLNDGATHNFWTSSILTLSAHELHFRVIAVASCIASPLFFKMH